MIMPWLRGFVSRALVPLTWTLVLLNGYIFLMTYDAQPAPNQDFFSDQTRFELTAKLYHEFKGGQGLPNRNQIFTLGAQAIHDVNFINTAERMNYHGDQVAIERWKKDLVEFRDGLTVRQAQIYGLSWDQHRPLTWITYQFMHAGFVHLLSNMLMLIIFGSALEMQIGGLGLIVIYILSGITGAIGFLLLGEPTLAPMIGASGSLSGIMAFYAVYERRKRVPFFFFLSPVQGFYGWVWLPTWFIFPLYFIADIAAYFGTLKELGSGVAYTAHIGGMIFGVLTGYMWRKINKGPLPSRPEAVT